MNKINIGFLSSFLVVCTFGVTGAFAAPSVRMLGTNTARVGSGATVVKAPTTSAQPTTQRLGTIRPKNIGTVAPVTVNKVVSPTVSATSGDESRLSLGKYIHAAGVASGTISQPGMGAVPGTTSSDFVNLVDRVSNLETSVESKQPALSAGTGLSLDNNTIVLDEDIASLPNQVNEMQDEIDTKISKAEVADNYYTKEQVTNVIRETVDSGVNVVYTSEDGVRTYDNVVIADQFDEDFDFNE